MGKVNESECTRRLVTLTLRGGEMQLSSACYLLTYISINTPATSKRLSLLHPDNGNSVVRSAIFLRRALEYKDPYL